MAIRKNTFSLGTPLEKFLATPLGVLCRQRDALLPVVGLLCELLCGVSDSQRHG